MSTIEALYIFNEHNGLILEQVFSGRPPSAKLVLPLYLAHMPPRPSLVYLPNTNPSTLLYSVIQDRILFIAASSTDTEPLLVLEFIQRVIDALEAYVGSPLLAQKIEGSYDVVGQLLEEMCDAGLVATTEPDALKEVVETPSWMKSFVGGLGLPSSSPALTTASSSGSLQRPQLPRPVSQNPSPVPWRRANVRHTSNELYVDLVETLSITVAPSGRFLNAIAAGTIAFTAKVSGVPDLALMLSAPGGVGNVVSLPVFHPCVRLARWRDRPGELSFVPPDGRFVLAGYEVDLLGDDPESLLSLTTKQSPNLNLPLSLEVQTGLGPTGSEFEIRLLASTRWKTSQTASTAGPSGPGRSGGIGRSGPAFGSGGTSNHPTVEEAIVSIPVPAGVRNIADLKATRGEAHYAPGNSSIEWTLTMKELNAMMTGGMGTMHATLHGAMVSRHDEEEEIELPMPEAVMDNKWNYDESEMENGSYQTTAIEPKPTKSPKENGSGIPKAQQNRSLMPSSASLSFQVKGWLASGMKVDSLNINTSASRGLGAGVQPYKGVKYLTISRKGLEVRC